MIEYSNEPFTDFTVASNTAKMRTALAGVKAEFGKVYPLVIGGSEFMTAKRLASVNPGVLNEIVGWAAQADGTLAEQALQAAGEAFPRWSRVKPEARAGYLFKAAVELRRRRLEFAAWMVFEVGKKLGGSRCRCR